MTVVDQDLQDLIEEFFNKKITPNLRSDADEGAWPQDVWEEAEELELNTLGLDEDFGGAGGSFIEALEVAMAIGRYAAPLPWAENFLGRWVAGAAEADLPAGPAVCLVVDEEANHAFSDNRISGTWRDVSWAPVAESFVVVKTANDQTDIAIVARNDVELHEGRDIAGQPKAHVSIDVSGASRFAAPLTQGQFKRRSLLVYSALMAGAMDGAFEMTQRYITERHQFGRPLAAFQSVQQHLVTLAQAASMSALSIQRAALSEETVDADDEAIAAAIAVRYHVDLAASAAHQAHGAMGMTREYGLQHLTRRLWLWRSHGASDTELKHLMAKSAMDNGNIMGLISRA